MKDPVFASKPDIVSSGQSFYHIPGGLKMKAVENPELAAHCRFFAGQGSNVLNDFPLRVICDIAENFAFLLIAKIRYLRVRILGVNVHDHGDFFCGRGSVHDLDQFRPDLSGDRDELYGQ
jgi:hypothetical protein